MASHKAACYPLKSDTRLNVNETFWTDMNNKRLTNYMRSKVITEQTARDMIRRMLRLCLVQCLENNTPIWDYETNKLGWKLYLGQLDGSKSIPYYASPALAVNYENLPNTYTFIGSIEPFYDETMKYIENLKKAGVKAKIDIYEGCYHAFDLFGRKTQVGKTATTKWIKEFKYAVENYYAKQEFFPYQSL